MKRLFIFKNPTGSQGSLNRPGQATKTNAYTMKNLLVLLIFVAMTTDLVNAQNSGNPEHKVRISVSIDSKKDKDSLDGEILAMTNDSVKKDTTYVRIGSTGFDVIEDEDGTEYHFGKSHHKRKNGSDRFDGHWEGLDLGFNSFAKTNYSGYESYDGFMDLNQPKSLEVSWNISEINIGLQREKNTIGLISGLGLTFNNYRFDQPYTLVKENGKVKPQQLTYENLSKTKLAVSYLTVPLLMEFQVPVNHHDGRLFVNAGVVGGVNIGSHTKVKYGDTKDKDHSNFSINPFKYAATARIGYKDISLFATYNLNPLFKDGKGPELTPFTIGIGLISF
jgi:hypothetical protein